jgi:hypothetical protein
MLRYLSRIFEFRGDKDHLTNRLKLIHLLINNLNYFQRDCADWIEEETFEDFIRIMIGSADFLAGSGQAFPESARATVLKRVFQVLLNVICTSGLRTEELWELFAHHAKGWTHLHPFVVSWREKLLDIFNDLLFRAPTDLGRFQLAHLIRAIDFSALTGHELHFTELGLLIDQLFQSTQKAVRSEQSLYFPLYPSRIFFELFGGWIFTPWNEEVRSGHGQIIRTVFTMVDSTYLPNNSPWVPALLHFVNKAIASPSLLIQLSVLRTGSYLLNRFYSDTLCEKLLFLAQRFEPPQQRSLDIWENYSVLLTVLSDKATLDPSILGRFMESSINLNAVADVLVILLKQNPTEFCSYAAKLYHHNSPIVETLNWVIAAYIPFINVDSLNDLLLQHGFACADQNRRVFGICRSFMAVLVQYHNYSDGSLPLLPRALQFLLEAYCEQGPDQLHMYSIVGRFLGRPRLDRASKKEVRLCFLVADRSIVTLMDDDTIEVRDSCGRLEWHLSELTRPSGLSHDPIEIGPLPPPKQIEPRPIPTSYRCPLDTFEEILAQIRSDAPYSEAFQEVVQYRDQYYLKLLEETKSQRNKMVDFIVHTGLSRRVRSIDEPIQTVLANFDSIPDVTIVGVPLIRLTRHGIADGESSHFSRLKSLLGASHHLGMLELHFPVREPEGEPVVIIFNESPFAINFKHEKAPRVGRLAIMLQPLDDQRFLLHAEVVDNKLRFQNNLAMRRVIDNGQILSTICTFLFRFFATKYEQYLFQADQQRSEFLKGIQATDLSALDAVREGAFLPK